MLYVVLKCYFLQKLLPKLDVLKRVNTNNIIFFQRSAFWPEVEILNKISVIPKRHTAIFELKYSNNSPQTKIPPVWKVMAGCPAQTIDLAPVDLDQDVIKCRWATASEGKGRVL